MMRDRRHHLDENELVNTYLDEAFGAASDGPAAERLHLRGCADCTRRYQALTGVLQSAVREGVEEADGIFSAERLTRQREMVLRKIEQAERAARVLPFPAASSRSMPATQGVARRWIAAAAAAGLLIGVAAGRAIDGTAGASRLFSRFSTSSAQPRMVSTPLLTSGRAPEGAAEENFLIELDAALESSSVTELLAIDELTPRIVEAGTMSELGNLGGAAREFPAQPREN